MPVNVVMFLLILTFTGAWLVTYTCNKERHHRYVGVRIN